MNKLSVVMITKNEELMLPLSLASVAWADEILLVDSGSTDQTLAIAEAAGARVLHHDFEGYAAQCNWAFEQATNAWILMLDADEVIEPDLRDSIQAVLAAGAEHEVYEVVRDAILLGRRMRASSWSNERLPRFFRKGRLAFTGLVHPIPVHGDRKPGLLEGRMLHHTTRTMEQYFAKLQNYTTLWAEEQFKNGRVVSYPQCLLASGWRFFHNYFFRGEILDGKCGFFSSVSSVVYTYTKYVKLWGLLRESRNAGDGRRGTVFGKEI